MGSCGTSPLCVASNPRRPMTGCALLRCSTSAKSPASPPGRDGAAGISGGGRRRCGGQPPGVAELPPVGVRQRPNRPCAGASVTADPPSRRGRFSVPLSSQASSVPWWSSGIAMMILATVAGVAAGLVVLGFSVTRHCAPCGPTGATGLGRRACARGRDCEGRLRRGTCLVAFAVAVASVPVPLVPPLTRAASTGQGVGGVAWRRRGSPW